MWNKRNTPKKKDKTKATEQVGGYLMRLAWALAEEAPCPCAGAGDWDAAGAPVSSVKSMASPATRADRGGGCGTVGADKAGGCGRPKDHNSTASF